MMKKEVLHALKLTATGMIEVIRKIIGLMNEAQSMMKERVLHDLKWIKIAMKEIIKKIVM